MILEYIEQKINSISLIFNTNTNSISLIFNTRHKLTTNHGCIGKWKKDINNDKSECPYI